MSFGGHPPWPLVFSLTPYSAVESKHGPLLFSPSSSLSSSGLGLLEPLPLSLSLSGSGLNQGFWRLSRFKAIKPSYIKSSWTSLALVVCLNQYYHRLQDPALVAFQNHLHHLTHYRYRVQVCYRYWNHFHWRYCHCYQLWKKRIIN